MKIKSLLLTILSVLFLKVSVQGQTCYFTSATNGLANTLVFTSHNQSVFMPDRYLWDFGDGSQSSDTMPIHTYQQPGVYQVCLALYDSNNVVFCNYCDSVLIQGSSVNCNFTHTQSPASLDVQFINQSIVGYQHQWTFGDGTSGTGPYPVHTYSQPGVYTVCLTITDSASNVVCTNCITIQVNGSTGTCSYTFVQDSLNPSLIYFSGQGNPGAQYTWSFGDNTSGTGQNVSHQYNTTGAMQVCMTATDSLGSCTWCDSVMVGLLPGNCYFTYTITGNGVLTFHASPAYPGSAIAWDFGDGSTGTGQTVTHTYSASGIYYVCMAEADSNGTVRCSSCMPVSITVSNPGNCSFIAFPDSSNSSLIYFNAQVSPGTSVTWSFGDNTSGTGSFISHLYNAPGIYRVCMTATDSLGTCTWCDSVTVGNPPVNCTYTYSTSGLTAVFQTSGSPALHSFAWDFGDGNTGSGAVVTHLYTNPGVYYVCVTQTDLQTSQVICTYCDSVVVSGNSSGCQAYFMYANAGTTAHFIDLSNFNPSISTYHWDFGDGNTSGVRFPQHTYAQLGAYNVCLTVAGGGCTSTWCDSVVIDTIFNPLLCRAYFVTIQLAPFQLAVVNLSSGLNLQFQWDFGDGTTSNLPYPSHYYNSTGSYNLCLTIADPNGCTSTYCDTVSVDSLGNIFRTTNGFTINVVSPDQLTAVTGPGAEVPFVVYPNPVADRFTIQLGNVSDPVEYTVYDITGSRIASGKMETQQQVLSAKAWSPGVYMLEVKKASGARSLVRLIRP